MTIANYAKNFDSYGGEKFTVEPASIARGNDHFVKSSMKTAKETIAFNYRMHQVGSDWKITDVYLAGNISQMAQKRSDFAATLSGRAVRAGQEDRRAGGPARLGYLAAGRAGLKAAGSEPLRSLLSPLPGLRCEAWPSVPGGSGVAINCRAWSRCAVTAAPATARATGTGSSPASSPARSSAVRPCWRCRDERSATACRSPVAVVRRRKITARVRLDCSKFFAPARQATTK